MRGWAYGYQLTRPDGRRALLLYDIDVAPESQRRGLGRVLFEAFVGEARSRGCFEVWLLADDDDQDAQQFYQALGGQRGDQALFTWSTGI